MLQTATLAYCKAVAGSHQRNEVPVPLQKGRQLVMKQGQGNADRQTS